MSTKPSLNTDLNKYNFPVARGAAVQLDQRTSSPLIPRGAYPCGCRFCLSLTNPVKRSQTNPLTAIDVYDLPGNSDREPSDYFH